MPDSPPPAGGGQPGLTPQPVPETPGFGATTLVDLVIGRRGLKPSRTGVVSIPVRNRNAFTVGAVLGLRSSKKIETARKKVVNFGSKRATLAAFRARFGSERDQSGG